MSIKSTIYLVSFNRARTFNFHHNMKLKAGSWKRRAHKQSQFPATLNSFHFFPRLEPFEPLKTLSMAALWLFSKQTLSLLLFNVLMAEIKLANSKLNFSFQFHELSVNSFTESENNNRQTGRDRMKDNGN